MAKRGGRLCAGCAPRACGPRSPALPPPPLLLLLLAGLALRGEARTPGGDGFSLHPPYFNLAEGARITASATCGEEAPARSASRPTEDLYCKLVGGPVAGGDPNQTIQVSAERRSWLHHPAVPTPEPEPSRLLGLPEPGWGCLSTDSPIRTPGPMFSWTKKDA